MNLKEIQSFLLSAFDTWGLPKQIRLDNGRPFRTAYRDVPSNLVLWLTGLGIEIIFNKIHTPQQNGVVENHNGLTTRWAEAHTKNSVEALQKAINHVKHYQIHQFPVAKLDGNTRIKAFPQLLLNQRKLEQQTFDFQNVLQLLSRYHWIRIVDKTGCISLFHQKISIGRAWTKKNISISFNPVNAIFTVFDEKNKPIKEFKIDSLKKDNIQNLTVFQRTKINQQDNPVSP